MIFFFKSLIRSLITGWTKQIWSLPWWVWHKIIIKFQGSIEINRLNNDNLKLLHSQKELGIIYVIFIKWWQIYLNLLVKYIRGLHVKISNFKFLILAFLAHINHNQDLPRKITSKKRTDFFPLLLSGSYRK